MFEGLTEFTKLRIGFAVLAVGALAACDPVPKGDTKCESAFACEVVGLMVKDMKSDIGKNFGGGVVLRNAQAVGQVFVADVTLPFSKAALGEQEGRKFVKIFGKAVARGFCSKPAGQEFFDAGGQLRARAFSKDNALVADQIILSCRGIKA